MTNCRKSITYSLYLFGTCVAQDGLRTQILPPLLYPSVLILDSESGALFYFKLVFCHLVLDLILLD